jgi:hypothetical protein
MTSTLDKLNLRPFEKRLVVGTAAVLFVVLNIWFVFPFFKDWSKTKNRMATAQDKLQKFETEVAQTSKYEAQVRALESEGLDVPQEDQAVQFLRVIQNQSALSGVNIMGTTKAMTRTNQFFLEQSQSVNVQSGEKQLVDFLYNLGSGNSLIRVRELTLGPDQTRMQLVANVQLVASYQKKPTSRTVPAAATTRPAATTTNTAAAAKPATPKSITPAVTNKTTPPATRSITLPAKTNLTPATPASLPIRTSAPPARAGVPAKTNLPAAPGATTTAK